MNKSEKRMWIAIALMIVCVVVQFFTMKTHPVASLCVFGVWLVSFIVFLVNAIGQRWFWK